MTKVEKDDFTYIGEGFCARVFSDGKTILKCYKKRMPTANRVTSGFFETLKSFKNPNFIELYESFPEQSLIERVRAKLGLSYIVGSYTAKYYQEENIDILNGYKEYLLYNLFNLEKLLNEFTENQIVSHDLSRDNVIYTSDDIIIVDPDLFGEFKVSKDIVKDINRKELIYLLENMIIASFNETNELKLKRITKQVEKFLNSIYFDKNVEVANGLSKKLGKAKTLGEFFR